MDLAQQTAIRSTKVPGAAVPANRNSLPERFKRNLRINYQLYLIIALPVIWLIIFRYVPMYGLQLAFRKYRAVDGIMGSQWVGFEQFTKFFESYMFLDVIKNTVILSVYSLLAGFPFPILFALALNNTMHKYFKKTVQLVTYIPHFISTVVLVGMIIQFLNPKVGIINHAVTAFGGTATDFMAKPQWFASIYVWSDVWQNCGWGTIIYLAALSGIDNALHESAMIDGANRFQRMLHIDLPGIMPTMVILLIMNTGFMLNIGFEKAFLMQNNLNRSASEIISTYVYKMGLASAAPDYSYATAIGLFNSIINLALIFVVNKISKRAAGTSLW